MSKRKGNRNEREGVELYGAAGFKAERIAATAGGRNMSDTFGQFDIIAVDPGRRLRLSQVKTNSGSGIREFVQWCHAFLPDEHAVGDFLIRYDGSGPRPAAWALRQVDAKEDRVTYQTLVDERKDGVPADGEAVAAYIREDTRAD